MDKQAYDELVKLVGEERAKQFADQVDDANRTITDTGMVTRAEEAQTSATNTLVLMTTNTTTPIIPEMAALPTMPAPSAAPPAVQPVVARQDAPPAPEPKPDDLAALRAQVAELVARVTKLEESYGMGMEESKRTQQRATDAITELTTRLADVEEIKARWLAWVNDAPEYVKAEADKVYRARNQDPAPMTMAQLAEQNVSKLNRGPHMRRTQSG